MRHFILLICIFNSFYSFSQDIPTNNNSNSLGFFNKVKDSMSIENFQFDVRKKYALYKRMSSSSSIAYRLANYAVPFDVNEIIHLLDLHAKEISSSFTSTPNPSSTSTSNSLPLSKSKLQKQLQVQASEGAAILRARKNEASAMLSASSAVLA